MYIYPPGDVRKRNNLFTAWNRVFLRETDTSTIFTRVSLKIFFANLFRSDSGFVLNGCCLQRDKNTFSISRAWGGAPTVDQSNKTQEKVQEKEPGRAAHRNRAENASDQTPKPLVSSPT